MGYLAIAASRFINRLLRRAALFLWMIPFWAARSREANGCQRRGLRNVLVAFDDGSISLRHQGAGTAAVNAVVDAAFFILPVAFDL